MPTASWGGFYKMEKETFEQKTAPNKGYNAFVFFIYFLFW
jgi:hypothetical protein